MKIKVIGVPLWEGSGVPGPEKGPAALIADHLEQRISQHGHSCSGCEVLPSPLPSRLDEADKLYYEPTVVSCCRQVETAVSRAMAEGSFPLVLGGDHALAIGSLSGVNEHIPAEDLTVIWVDAHTDINTDLTSDSHHIHGMPVAALLGEGDHRLIDGFGRTEKKLLPENLIYIGSRSVDPGEWEFLRQHNIRVFTMDEVAERGMEAVVDDVLAQIKTPWVHVSFDVDFMDKDEFSATGLPVPDGPSVADTDYCLGRLLSCGRISSMDFVEYKPSCDPDGAGLKVCSDLLDRCLDALSGQNRHAL